MMTIKNWSLFVSAVLFMGACATMDTPQKSNFTPGVAKSLLVKGKTTQADIVKVWGSPNVVTRNAQGEEVWTYSKQSYDAKSSAGMGTLFLVTGSKAVSQSAVSSFDVVVTFDSQDVVRDFSISSSQF